MTRSARSRTTGARAVRRRLVRAGHPRPRPRSRARLARPAGHAPGGLRLRRHQRRGVRRGVPGAGGGGLGAAQLRVRAGLAGDVRDPPLGHRGAQGGVAAADGRPARRSAASASPSPTPAATPRDAHPRGPRRGDWVLNGSKMWITNGTLADVAVVWAQTDDGIRGFVVPTETPGLHATEIQHKLSLRASVTAELSFDDVRLPGARYSPRCAACRGRCRCLNEARYGILWGAVGAARACYARPWSTPCSAAVRQAAGGVPAHPEEARRDGHRGQQRLPRRAADRPAQGRGRAAPRAGELRQARQRPRGASTWRGPPGPCWAATGSRWSTR